MTHALIPTFQGIVNDMPQTMCNARDLHTFLEVGRDFSSWIKGRIEQYGFVEELDYLLAKTGEQVDEYSPVLGSIPRGRGQPRIEFHLSMDMAKELAMIENNDKGRAVRRYFIRMEAKAKGFIPSPSIVREYGITHPNALLYPEEKQLLLEIRPDWKAISELVLQGLNGLEIADKLKSSKSTVCDKISRMRMCGILPPDPRRMAVKVERALLKKSNFS